MAELHPPKHQVVQAIYRLYEEREAARGGHRAHLGASVIGHPCERHAWLLFRWVAREAFDGRMLRLFEAGKAFEPRIVAELRAVGIEVHDTDELGRQYRVSAVGGHFGGSLDGAALGLPEAPKTWHVMEFKTHSAKSFAELLKVGVREAKPMHWFQMQIYMGLTGMQRAMYLAENKDTSALYQERVEFDAVEFARVMAKAERVVTSPEPPPRLSNDPAWFACKWCTFHPVCHGDQAPEVNCRTCAHSTPELDGQRADGGRWSCAMNRGSDLSLEVQRAGCGGHRYIPILLERIGEQVGAADEHDGNATVTYRTAAGETFANGAPPAFSSAEIAAAKHKTMLADGQLQQIKRAWPGAKVVA